MALRFKCSSCGSDIYVSYLRPGETAECRSCGAENTVPERAVEAEAPRDYLMKEAAVPWRDNLSARREPVLSKCPKCKIVLGDGADVCPNCNLRFSTISLYNPRYFIWLSMLMSFMVPAYIASANWGRLGNEGKRRVLLVGGLLGLSAAFVFFFMLEEIFGIDPDEARGGMRSLQRLFAYGINLPIGYLLKRQQTSLFEAGTGLGMRTASLWKGVLKGVGFTALAFGMTIVVVAYMTGNPVTDAYDLAEQERYEEAAAAYDSLLATHPDNPELLWNSAVCHAACREYAAAATSMQAYMELVPGDAAAYAILGQIRAGQGLIYESRRLLAIADSIQPGVSQDLVK